MPSAVAPRLVFTGPRQVELQPVPVSPPGPGEVQIRTLCSLISTGTELTVLEGTYPAGSFWTEYGRYPYLPGYSNVGSVAAVGPGVEGFAPGDRVVSAAGHGQLVNTSADLTLRVPASVSDTAASFTILSMTVLNAIRLARVALGDHVVVVGLGLLGQLGVRLLRLTGARPLIGIDPAPSRLGLAADAVHHALLGPAGAYTSEVCRLTSGEMADVAFEVTGLGRVISETFPLVRRGGRLVLLGSQRDAVPLDLGTYVHWNGVELLGGHVSTHPPVGSLRDTWTRRRNGQLFLDLLERGEVSIEALVTHRFRAAEAGAAYSLLLEDRTRAVGVMLDWT